MKFEVIGRVLLTVGQITVAAYFSIDHPIGTADFCGHGLLPSHCWCAGSGSDRSWLAPVVASAVVDKLAHRELDDKERAGSVATGADTPLLGSASLVLIFSQRCLQTRE